MTKETPIKSVRPKLVEGQIVHLIDSASFSIHGSTGSPRAEDLLGASLKNGSHREERRDVAIHDYARGRNDKFLLCIPKYNEGSASCLNKPNLVTR